MNQTDSFSEEMKKYFECEDGAYTAFTDVELGKGTYNVKSVIRQLLVKKIGKENIPIVNVTPNQDICFEICPKAKIYGTSVMKIPCKFSKKDKDEMTIYFNQEIIKSFNAAAGDIWYIYFKDGSSAPVLGVLSKDKWDNLFGEVDEGKDESDVIQSDDLNYLTDVSDMKLIEETAPDKATVIRIGKATSVVRSLSAEEAAKREKNRKKKGNRGEDIAVEIEKRRLADIGRMDLVEKVVNVARVKDGLGYDLISTDIDENGNEIEIYIEVKATSEKKDTPFYVTPNEVEVSRRLSDYYYIYRIYEMNTHSSQAKYYRIKGAIDTNYELVPTEYLAYKK
ncbi:DUF3883 domain-containing protein [Butyrivibrio sp. MC2013]|uniref:DUF3883 domain-containing protein n=1 Tax=Butyrivibrio sp. MC2013 TaxID=1280686 RepID=UPI00041C87C0|nr:DUF3883 domain-containing protein [Butyrivibrio sp. MC2013]